MPKPENLDARFAREMACASVKSALESDTDLDPSELARTVVGRCGTMRALHRAHEMAMEMTREAKDRARDLLAEALPELDSVEFEEETSEFGDFGFSAVFNYYLHHTDGTAFPVPAGCLMDDLGDLFGDILIPWWGKHDPDVAEGIETGCQDAWARAFGRAFRAKSLTADDVEQVIAMLELQAFGETVGQEIAVRWHEAETA